MQAAMPRPAPTRSAFTLIELLVVMAIITVLITLTFGVSRAVSRRMTINTAKAEITSLMELIEEYRVDNGEYPPTGQACFSFLVSWFNAKYNMEYPVPARPYRGGARPADLRYLADPWNWEYFYELISPEVYKIGSRGPDERWGTEDDITNFSSGLD